MCYRPILPDHFKASIPLQKQEVSFGMRRVFPRGSLLRSSQADLHMCEAVPGPRKKAEVIPGVLGFALRINAIAEEPGPAKPWTKWPLLTTVSSS